MHDNKIKNVINKKFLWSASEISEFFKVSQNTVYKWPIDSVTKRAGHKPALYDLREVYKYLHGENKDDISSEKKNDESLLRKINIESAKIDLEIKKGNIIYADNAREGYKNLLVLFRTSLTSQKIKLARRLSNKKPSEVKKIISKENQLILAKLEKELDG